MTQVFLGLDLGATKMLSICVDSEGRQLGEPKRFTTGRRTGPEVLLNLVRTAVEEALADGVELLGVGLGFPGLVDHERGIAMSSVMVQGWDRFPLADRIAEIAGVPCFIDNDVNTAAIAELHLRPGIRSMLFAAVGTGIGGALVLNGELIRGISGCAGELGHIAVDRAGKSSWDGRKGTLNALSSGTALELSTGLTGEALSEAWRQQKFSVVAAVEDAAESLGIGLANAVYVVNPEQVVIGGGIASLGDDYLALVRDAARGVLFKEASEVCEFSFARAGYEAGAIGSALMARQLVG
jgi:glucokinase